MVEGGVFASKTFNENRPENDPNVGIFIYLLAAAAVIGGFIFGYDASIVSAAMLYVPDNPGMQPVTDEWHELIVSVTSGMAILGALLSGQTCDLIGRKMAVILGSLIFAFGSLVCAAAWNKVVLVIGRVFIGIAIGFSSISTLVYVGETSPSSIRGSLVSTYQVMIALGQVSANLIGGGLSYIDPANVGWRLMFGLAALPALFQCVCFFFLPESPRYLYKKGRKEETEEVLRKIYGTSEDWVTYEMEEISMTLDEEKRALESCENQTVLRRILTTPHVLKATIVGSLCRVFQQLCGVNNIMYYTGDIIKSTGIKSSHTSIWISAATTSLNFLGTLVPALFIERMGRRKIFLFSIVAVLISLIALGTAFKLINDDSHPTYSIDEYNSGNHFNSSFYNAQRCMKYRNCDRCVTQDGCGYCEDKVAKSGYCLPFKQGKTDGDPSTGVCSSPDFMKDSTWEWEESYCYTSYTLVPIFIIVVYQVVYGIGFGPIVWVVNSEIFPLWARSTSASISSACGWTMNLILALTFLSMNEALTKYGTFYVYAGCTVVALVFVYFMVPETRGYSIEEVELLFMSEKNRLAAQEKLREKEAARRLENETSSVDRL